MRGFQDHLQMIFLFICLGLVLQEFVGLESFAYYMAAGVFFERYIYKVFEWKNSRFHDDRRRLQRNRDGKR